MNNKNEKNEAKLLDHDYDGIKELDNPLPSWWVAIFVITTAFAIIYFFYYQFGGPTLMDEHKQSVEANNKLKQSAVASDSSNSGGGDQFNVEKFNAILASPDKLKMGLDVFEKNCVSCHKSQGQGDIGPNLTDEYWINGDGSPEKIYKIVTNGVLENGMPAWKDVLSSEDIYLVTAYIKSIKGVKLEGAKAPQGNKFE